MINTKRFRDTSIWNYIRQLDSFGDYSLLTSKKTIISVIHTIPKGRRTEVCCSWRNQWIISKAGNVWLMKTYKATSFNDIHSKYLSLLWNYCYQSGRGIENRTMTNCVQKNYIRQLSWRTKPSRIHLLVWKPKRWNCMDELRFKAYLCNINNEEVTLHRSPVHNRRMNDRSWKPTRCLKEMI